MQHRNLNEAIFLLCKPRAQSCAPSQKPPGKTHYALPERHCPNSPTLLGSSVQPCPFAPGTLWLGREAHASCNTYVNNMRVHHPRGFVNK